MAAKWDGSQFPGRPVRLVLERHCRFGAGLSDANPSVQGVMYVAKMPNAASKAWEEREGPEVLATVDKKGAPNAIDATYVSKPNDEHLLVADNYSSKTRANIEAGSKGRLLFMTKGGDSFQVKGSLRRCAQGPYVDGMKKWLDPSMPGRAAAVLSIEEAYCGSEKLL